MEKINSRKNKTVTHARLLGKDRVYREKHKEFLCDGRKLLEDALRSGADVTSIFAESAANVPVAESAETYLVSADIIKAISPLKNPQDILFTCRMPDKNIQYDISRGTYILLDNVQDPGNAGTVIRSADAFGIDGVILLHECADVYNPKTIRASMGAIFRQKIIYTDIERLKNSGTRIYGTGNNTGFIPLEDAALTDCVIALGNEGSGLSKQLLDICDEMITIPITAGCESLNIAAAASIFMYKAKADKDRVKP